MDLITILTFTIFGATLVTIIMALTSFGAFKLREWRKPHSRSLSLPTDEQAATDETRFFRRYLPPDLTATPDSTGTHHEQR